MPRIDALYAWIATEADGGEGVCGAHLPGTDTLMMPLIGADRERVASLREYAELVRAATGCRVRLVRFAQREELEELP